MTGRLYAPAGRLFPLRELSPRGWYLRQLQIQRNGLSGHLDQFWPDIKDSQWIGGTCEGWERLPYWLDGVIPLAALLNDEPLLARIHGYIDTILTLQAEDGWLSPPAFQSDRKHFDLWASFLLLKALITWHNATGDSRIQPVVERALYSLDRHLDVCTLFDWGQMRWFECLIPIYWLYEKTRDDSLLVLANKMRAQGFDWCGFFQNGWPYRQPPAMGCWSQMSHVVNNAMMLKLPALLARLDGSVDAGVQTSHMLGLLEAYHGLPHGMFSGDECLAGRSPIRGTELCAVAEYMYSMQFLLPLAPSWGDKLERVAFNAWPATFDPMMWTHQYDQQINQPQAAIQSKSAFGTNPVDSAIFGLEPNFGCCTANLSQGWPKLSQSIFYQTEEGIALGAYLPCTLNTKLNGVTVQLSLETDYPFDELICLRIFCSESTEFSIALRIPQWADCAELMIGEQRRSCLAGSVQTIRKPWRQDIITLRLPMKCRAESGQTGVSIFRGPLLYALQIQELSKRIHADIPGRELPHGDFEKYPASEWRYALDSALKPNDIAIESKPLGTYPFAPDTAPVVLHLPAYRIDWPLIDGCVQVLPDAKPLSGMKTVSLIPYGCTNIRIAEFPQCAQNAPSSVCGTDAPNGSECS